VPQFAYVARDPRGQRVTGTLVAPSEREAITMLDTRELFPIQVAIDQPRQLTRRGRKVKGQLIATTYSQLASLLRSGVPLLRSLKVLKEQTSNAALAEVLERVYSQVEDGVPLGDAMGQHPRVFNEIAISMVRAGSEGGFLEDALQRVAHFTEQQEEMKGRVAGGVAYPIFLGTVGVIVVTFLLIFFVPRFEPMFARLKELGELPLVTQWLLMISNFVTGWSWLAAIVLIGAGILVRNHLRTPDGRLMLDKIKLRVPGAGPIYMNLAVARFCRVLGTLLHNGVPILKSLAISASAANNRVLSGAIDEAAENISAGQSLAAPLAASGHFPRTIIEMIAVAEQANNLEIVLTEIADSLERRTWRQLDLFVRLLEPMMLVIMAGMVLFVVAGLVMPMLKGSMTV
jgi:type II secretory pathway component PulF